MKPKEFVKALAVWTIIPTLIISGTALANDAASSVSQPDDHAADSLNQKAAQKRKAITDEAVTAITETQNALKALDDKKPEEAIAALESAVGKLELILARDPSLSLATFDVSTVTYDLYGSVDSIRSAVEEAKDMLDDGQVQQARRMLDGLASEFVIRESSIPLATYPDGIRAVVPLIDEGKIEEARTGLEAVLDTVVVTDTVIPLPFLRAEDRLSEAQTLADQKDRSDEDSARLKALLTQAREQLKIAKELGYVDKPEYKSFNKQIDKLSQQTEEGTADAGFIQKIRGYFSSLSE